MAQIAAGLGVLPGVIVDQHFQQRNRLGRLLWIIAQNPALLGLGIDEDTAGVVGPDHVMEVIGRGAITIVDGAQSETDAWEVRGHRPIMISGVVLHSLPAGYRFDLRRRERLAAPRLRALPGSRGRVELVTSRRPGTVIRSRRPRRNPWPRPHPRPAPSAAALARPRPSRPSSTRVRRLRRCGSSRPACCAGPNYWAREPVIRMLVDLGVLEAYPSNKLPGFTDALIALLPTLEDHACSLGRRGGFITRLRDGTWVGHIAEHVALELQNLAGTEVRHGKTRSAGPHGQYNGIFEYREEQVGLEAGRWPSRWSTTSSRRTTPRSPSTSRPSWSGSSGSPSARPSGRPRRRSSTRPSAATSPSSASTAIPWSSSARASTSSASARR